VILPFQLPLGRGRKPLDNAADGEDQKSQDANPQQAVGNEAKAQAIIPKNDITC
jgi:hypothetical protein